MNKVTINGAKISLLEGSDHIGNVVSQRLNSLLLCLDGLTFEKKEERCNCEEMTCKIKCTKNHTCHAYSCEKCNRGLEYKDSEEQKPFSVDNPPLNGSEYWYIENDAKKLS